ncbi:MAG: hypothetical protein NTW86_18680 [Candidatus Sumerlaeota bacterium]|nr:hypothetical protein [Candidatus Sumerlaeota bacterium]
MSRIHHLLRNPTARRIAFVNLALALLVAGGMMPRIGRSRIDVGLDLVEGEELPAPVDLAPTPPEKFFDRDYRFDLIATGERNPRSKGAEVWLNQFPHRDRLQQDPPDSWVARDENLMGSQAAVHWDGPLSPPLIVLGKHDYSGIARLTTSAGDEVIDLFDPDGGWVVKPIPPAAPRKESAKKTGPSSRASGVTVAWGDAVDERTTMRPIDDEDGPGKALFRFELIATGLKNQDSKGKEVWITDFRELSSLKQDPPNSWRLVNKALVSRDATFPCVRWEGIDTQAVITLLKHPWSGVALLRTSAGDQLIDLYDPEGNKTITIPIAPVRRPVKQYRASIPRRALAGFRISLGDSGRFPISRLYVGSFWPTIFLASGAEAGEDVWGRVIPHWSPSIEQGRLIVPSLSRLEQGGWATFGVLAPSLFALGLGLSVLAFLASRLCRWLVRQSSPGTRTLAPFRAGPFLAFWRPLVVVWTLIWLCFWPATMETDSCFQWHQAQTMQINDWHPPLHTLTMKLASMAWASPGALIAVHILALSLCAAYGFSLLLRAGVPRRLVIAAYLVALCSPRNAMMAVLEEKDVLYSVCVFLFAVMLAHSLLDHRMGRRLWFWVALGVCLGLIPLYRHNGIAILLPMLLLLPVFLWPWRKLAILSLAVALLVFGGARLVLFPLFRVEHLKGFWPVAYAMTELSPIVAQDPPLSQEERDFLTRIRPMTDRWDYSPVTSNPALYKTTDLPYAEANADRLLALFGSLLERYPGLVLHHHQLNAAYLIVPWDSVRYPIEYPYTEYFGGAIRPNAWADKYGIAIRPFFPELHAAILEFLGILAQRPLNWLFWRVGLPLYAVLAALGILLARLRDWRLLLVYLPALLNTAFFLLGTPSQSTRYQFPLTFSAAFLVCLAFLPKTGAPSWPAANDAPPCPETSEHAVRGATSGS